MPPVPRTGVGKHRAPEGALRPSPDGLPRLDGWLRAEVALRGGEKTAPAHFSHRPPLRPRRNVNVPFSHPTGGRAQKDGRKVRPRDEGTLTFRARRPSGPARGWWDHPDGWSRRCWSCPVFAAVPPGRGSVLEVRGRHFFCRAALLRRGVHPGVRSSGAVGGRSGGGLHTGEADPADTSAGFPHDSAVFECS